MKKIYGLAMAAALFGLASCSSDDAPEVNNPDVIDGPVVGYVKMNLSGATRADYDNTAIFRQGTTTVTAKAVEGYAGVYALSAIPDNVVVFRGQTTVPAMSATTTDYDVCSPAVQSDNKYEVAVPYDNIFHSLEDAGTATAIDVYLDRVYAEATVTVAANAVDLSGKKFDGYEISFTPEFVFVNGVATKTPIIKQLPAKTGTNISIQGNDVAVANIDYSDANGKGSHWTNTSYAWSEKDNVTHYAIGGDNAIAAATKQENVKIFERALQAANGATKDFTHVIVAGKYTLTGAKVPTSGWDGTFYVYGANADGEGIVFFSEADVVKAMGGSATDKLELAKTTDGGMSTHMTLTVGNVTKQCVKYDQGYVYYAAPIVTTIGTNLIGTGIVRNHKYTINVSQIKGFGTAIPNIEEPIIPEDPKNPESNFVKLNIVVNDMVNVANQDVKW